MHVDFRRNVTMLHRHYVWMSQGDNILFMVIYCLPLLIYNKTWTSTFLYVSWSRCHVLWHVNGMGMFMTQLCLSYYRLESVLQWHLALHFTWDVSISTPTLKLSPIILLPNCIKFLLRWKSLFLVFMLSSAFVPIRLKIKNVWIYGFMMLHSMKFLTFLVSAHAFLSVSSTDLGAQHKDECALVVHYSQDNSKMSLFSFTHRKSSLFAKQMTPLKFPMNRKPCELSVTGCLTRIFFFTHLLCNEMRSLNIEFSKWS